MEHLPTSTRAVGVFVNQSRSFVEHAVRECGLWAAQIHGDEPAAEFAATELRLWRAVHFSSGACRPRPEDWPAARYVLDARAPGQYGGTGRTIDWQMAAEVAARVPALLAGGLTPENVAEAIRAVRPLGVDVVSGVEAAPGRKDRARLAAFVRAARSASAT
jgi:phosphoribosylanthranilate isomerase